MRLSHHLQSLSNHEAITEINRMLDAAHVCISWSGQRIVTVDGYEGSVALDKLVSKYFHAEVFRWYGTPSLQDRLDGYALWERVRKLYTDSDVALKGVYKRITPLRESIRWRHCDLCEGNLRTILITEARRNVVFAFHSHEFKKLWPGAQPESQPWDIVNDTYYEKYTASKEMVEKALARERATNRNQLRVMGSYSV